MTIDSATTLPDWENPAILSRSRQPPRATLFPYPIEAAALGGDHGQSPLVKLLNGHWQFRYIPNPGTAPPAFASNAAAEPRWGTIPVPGCWQLHGNGIPVYTNVLYPFPVDPPRGGYSLPPAIACTSTFTIYGTGDVVIATNLTPLSQLPPLPRVGLHLRLPGTLDRFIWYGRGPLENYPDRKESAAVGRYSGTVQEQYEPYITPQDNGTKTDTR